MMSGRMALAGLTGVALTFVSLVFTGCGVELERDIYSDRLWRVSDDTTVREVIEVDHGWPDATYRRIYTISKAGVEHEVGRYENESSLGVLVPPFEIENHIAILSSCRVYLIDSNSQARTFTPFDSDGWRSYATAQNINGHYDYTASNIERHERGWTITYRKSTPVPEAPEEFRFTTQDEWQSFQLQTSDEE